MMADSPPVFKRPSLRKKSPTHPAHPALRNRRHWRKSCVVTTFILVLAFYLLSRTSPYHTLLSPQRLARFLWKYPMREHDSHLTTANKTPPSLSCKLLNSSFHSLSKPSPDIPAVLRDYAAWHKRQRSCLVDPQCKQKPKLLVLRCANAFCLGLGDRMRGVLFSLFYAIVMKRLFIIAWPPEPFPLQVALTPASIDWTFPEGWKLNESWPYIGLLYCPVHHPCKWRQPAVIRSENMDMNDRGINFYSDDLEERFGHYDVIAVTPGLRKRYNNKKHLIKDIFSGLNDTKEDLASMEKAVLRTLFRPSKSVIAKMQSVTFGAGKPYYGVQIRTGIDVNETDEERFKYINTHLGTTIRNILDCLEIAGQKAPLQRIFLAADSTMAKDLFVEKARQRGFDVKLFREEIIHFLKVNFIGTKTLDDDLLCDRFLTLFADLYMLSRSRILVSTGSHFADFAHALSGTYNSTHVLYRPELGDAPREICSPFTDGE